MNSITRRRLGLALAAVALGVVVVTVSLWFSGRANPTGPAVPVAAKAKHGTNTLRYAADAPELSALRTIKVQATPYPASAPFNGRVAYNENATARVSSPVAGRVVKMQAEIGHSVRRNDPLAEIDAPDLASAQADLAKADADAVRKKLAVDRGEELVKSQIMSKKDFESLDADYRQARAEVQRARQRMHNLDSASGTDGKFVLRSPIAGIVADRQINPGLQVRTDLANPLFTITDRKHPWVLTDIPESAIHTVRAGDAVQVEADAWPNERFTGHVEVVGLALDPTTRRLQVRCSVDNENGHLMPEMFVRVTLLAANKAAVVRIPNTGLVLQGSKTYVIVQTEPGVFKRQQVHVAVNGLTDSFIDSGLPAGADVVTDGALLLNAEFSEDAR